jgi:hypothetical protein
MKAEPVIDSMCGCLECREYLDANAQHIFETLGVRITMRYPSPEKSLRHYSLKEVNE